jgi:hypothetical protein
MRKKRPSHSGITVSPGMEEMPPLNIITKIIIIIVNCIWVVTRWLRLFYMFTNMKLFTNIFKPRGLHEKHVVATWNVGNRLSICLYTQGNKEVPLSRWPVAGPTEH